MTNKNTLIEKFNNSALAKTIINLSDDILNFKHGFKGSIKKTFVLSHNFSNNVGINVDPFLKKIVLGLPPTVFSDLCNLNLQSISINPKNNSIFLIVEDLNSKSEKTIYAFKIPSRRNMMLSISKFDSVRFVKINNDNSYDTITRINSFELPVVVIDGLYWEK